MAEARRDYYDVLGVPHGADTETLKRAFRSRARELHPDVSDDPDAEAKFSEVAEAYEVLSKPTARLLYDRFGYRGWGRGGLGSAPGQGDPLDLARARARRRGPGLDTVVELPIDGFEAAHGTSRRVQLAVVAACGACDGGGAGPGASWSACGACRGDGRMRRVSSSTSGQLLQIDPCGDCRGRGRVPSHPCPECGGSGRVRLERSIHVRIPPGARDGQRIRLTEDGRAQGLAGNAYVVVRVGSLPEMRFVRHASAVGLALALATLVAVLFFG